MSSAGRWLIFLAIAILVVVIGLLSSLDSTPDAPASASREPTRSATREAERRDPTTRAPTTKDAPVVAPVVRQPGRVHGFVRDALGTPQPGVSLALVGAAVKPIASMKTTNEGAFTLTDVALEATAITVNGERRELVPLGSGEERELVLIVGETREVVGWVLDLAGDPQSGALVTLTSDDTGGRWSAWTDGNGGFRFGYAPPGELRVVADALDLGTASARLAASDRKRREVTLVLEPSATLIVHAPPGITGPVLVRSWDPQAHGEDGLYGADTEEGYLATLDAAIRQYDPATPDASLERVVLSLARISDDFASELRTQALIEDPSLEGAPLAALVKPATRYLLKDEPHIHAQLRIAAEELRNGADIGTALERSNAAREAPETGEAIVEREPAVEAIERVRAATGAPDVSRRRSDQAVVARGVLDREIILRGALEYEVSIAVGGAEIECGRIVIDIGDVVEITCGRLADAAIAGRVFDTSGRPIDDLQVETYVDDKLVTAETDARGRFVLRARIAKLTPLTITFGTAGSLEPTATRRGIAARPGQTIDIGAVLARTPSEMPTLYPTSPYGSVVVESTLGDTASGYAFGTVDPMSPIGLEGVEDGAALIAVDELDATHLAREDIMAALRGEPETEVALRLRSVEGELYDIIVKRALIETPKALIGPQ